MKNVLVLAKVLVVFLAGFAFMAWSSGISVIAYLETAAPAVGAGFLAAAVPMLLIDAVSSLAKPRIGARTDRLCQFDI